MTALATHPSTLHPLTEPVAGELAETTPHSCRPELAKALAAAQAKCKPAEKDAVNSFHKYKYASGESIITAAKEALSGSGLSLVCSPPNLSASGEGVSALWQLTRNAYLVHECGEIIPLGTIRWPVIPEKGRPLDKAYAGAITTSLAYFLRDLLLMPRVDPADDLAGQTTEPTTPAAKNGPPPAAPPAVPAELLTDDQRRYLTEKFKGKGDWAKSLLPVFGVSRYGECLEAWWTILRIIVDRDVLAPVLHDLLHGKTVNQLTSEEITEFQSVLSKRFSTKGAKQ